jgi:hypothetical protein
MSPEQSAISNLEEAVKSILLDLPSFKLTEKEKQYRRILSKDTKFNGRFGKYKLALQMLEKKLLWFSWVIVPISVSLFIRVLSPYKVNAAADVVITFLALAWMPSLIFFTAAYQDIFSKIDSYLRYERANKTMIDKYFDGLKYMLHRGFEIRNNETHGQAIKITQSIIEKEILRLEISTKHINFLELALAFITVLFSTALLGELAISLIKASFSYIHYPQAVSSLNSEKMFLVSIPIFTIIHRDVLIEKTGSRIIELKRSVEYLDLLNRQQNQERCEDQSPE